MSSLNVTMTCAPSRLVVALTKVGGVVSSFWASAGKVNNSSPDSMHNRMAKGFSRRALTGFR